MICRSFAIRQADFSLNSNQVFDRRLVSVLTLSINYAFHRVKSANVWLRTVKNRVFRETELLATDQPRKQLLLCEFRVIQISTCKN